MRPAKLKFYVATSTNNIKRARDVHHLLRELGHEITHDWTQTVEANGGRMEEDIPRNTRAIYARKDIMGVYNADVVIALGYPGLCGTLWECGAAVVSNRTLWLVDWELCDKQSIFQALEYVKQFPYSDLLNELLHLHPTEVPPSVHAQFGVEHA